MWSIHKKPLYDQRNPQHVYGAVTENLNSHNIRYQEQLVIMEQAAHVAK